MDKKQLVTIAVTAVISVIAKEAITWLISFAKISAVRNTTKESVRKIFSKNNRAIILDLFLLGLNITLLVYRMRQITVVTRFDILVLPFYLFSILFWVGSLIFHVGVAAYNRRIPPRSD
jgi:hypothetical protein